RPVSEHLTDRRPARGVAGDARRAGRDQGGELLAEALDGGPAAVVDADAQHHLRRLRGSRDDPRDDVAGPQPLPLPPLRPHPGPSRLAGPGRKPARASRGRTIAPHRRALSAAPGPKRTKVPLAVYPDR